ncbi:hypothetical protein [Streptomyces sp. NPDC018347]
METGAAMGAFAGLGGELTPLIGRRTETARITRRPDTTDVLKNYSCRE